MSIENENYLSSISCSWVDSVPQKIVSAGETTDSREWNEDGGIIHVVNEEDFLFLEKHDEPCRVTLQLSNSSTQITNISVVSEAKIIELYGKYGEYIKTCKCELLSESSEISYYAAQTDLLTCQEISIKFPCAKNGLWLCGIKILVKNVAPSITSSFDYNLVDDKLKKSSIPITEKAQQFKKFLHDYASSKYSTTSNTNLQTFLRIMEGEYKSHLRPVGTASSNISKYLTNLMPSMMQSEQKSQSFNEADNDSTVPGGADKGNSHSMKEYVDERLQKLEEKLEISFQKQLTVLESKQNEKLDAILSLLKNSSVG